MGVPAFFRWLSEKYPRTVIDMIEQRPHTVDGVVVPLDLTQPNPNQMEFDNLYIDMNGIIHPCSHPEDRPMPKSEAEMFVNVMMYVDRIFAAVRPRKLLFLAIDGVAPRAKMNQQRTRRFRAAGDARERHEIKMQTRQEMMDLGCPVPPEELEKEWDSNVITPGTEFMTTLAQYLRFFVAHRVNTNKAWQNIKVLFSDGSEPGEGEHKIMDYIRKERAQPGYDPNMRHILHGLDADLIMLALATHEPHFTILREQVFFGRRGRDAPTVSDAQRAFDAAQGQPAPEGGDRFPYLKPFQMLHIPTLREYLRAEFSCLEEPGRLQTFAYDFERVVDDFVFLCFFVGNDFLPHLPSLDIRDGAIDFLFNVYKRVLPALGDYLTTPGGGVNLEKVDVILAEVGRVEDEVFRRRYAGEAKHRARLEQKIRTVERRAGGTMQQLQDKIVPEHVVALGAAAAKARELAAQAEAERVKREAEEAAERAKQKAEANKKNLDVAKALRASLRKGTKALKRERSQSSTSLDGDESASLGSRSTTPTTSAGGGEEEAGAAAVKAEPGTEGGANGSGGGGGVQSPKRIKLEAVETTAEGRSARIESKDGRVKVELSTEVSVTTGQANVEGEQDGEDEEDEDEDEVDDEEEEVKEELEKVAHEVVGAVPPELEGTELAAAQKELAERVKAKQEAKLEKLRQEIEDTIRYHEAGWKERYYADKLKKHNVEKGGGKAHMCRTYIEGLCWVFQYYYRGCQAWGWFYPFHYAPFASDLVNIDQYEIAFELGTPLRPLEQLMAVLPPESADALPLPLARLMTAEDSPIKDFYPREVEVDPNGKAMPWLWVTLLPFIDEGRLLETIRAAEAELSPVERKRNELGPSLLCLHEYHPSFRAVADVAGPSAAPDAKALALAAASHDGFSGTLSPPPPEARLELGALIPAPRNPPYALQDVEDNRALMAAFKLPPQSTPHASVLLPGLAYPPARLSQRDLMPRRPPRLGRGLNIADLGMQFGFTEMHAHQRMIMHNMPRGPGGPGMMMGMAASQHQYHQGYGGGAPSYGMGHLAGGMGAMSVGPLSTGPTGNRSWGSLEPGINQMKHGGRGPALPPPLMGMPGRPGLPPPQLLVPPGMVSAGPPRPPMPPQPVGPPPLMPWLAAGRGGPPPSLYPQGGMAPRHPLLQPPRPYGGGAGPRPVGGLSPEYVNGLVQQVARAVEQRNQEGGGGGGHGHHRQGGGGRLQPPHGSGGGGGGYRR